MRSVDIAVVGAGAAGVSAALAAAETGRTVALVDEQDRIGGSLRWSLAAVEGFAHGPSGARGFELAAWLEDRLARTDVRISTGAVAWGLFEDNVLTITEGDLTYRLRAGAIILATGATDITLPFPGWELPGVMTATAFQKAVNLYRVAPGWRIAVIGDGPAAAEVVESAQLAGIHVVARVGDSRGITVEGTERVECVATPAERVACDAVVIALGRQPDPELALHALCDTVYSPLNGCHVPRRDRWLRTTVAGVYIAGDAGGICTTAEALAEGRLAGLAAAEADHAVEAAQQLDALRTPERRAEIEAHAAASTA